MSAGSNQGTVIVSKQVKKGSSVQQQQSKNVSSGFFSFLDSMIEFFYILFNPAKFPEQEGKKVKLLPDIFSLSTDIKRLAVTATAISVVFIGAFIVFSGVIQEILNLIPILGKNMFVNLPNTADSIITTLALIIGLVIFALYLAVFASNFIALSTIDNLEKKDKEMWHYLKYSMPRLSIYSPIVYLLLLGLLVGAFYVGNGYISNITLFGSMFLTLMHPMQKVIGFLFVTITSAGFLMVVLYAPAEYHKNNRPSIFKRITKTISANRYQWIKNELIILFCLLLFCLITYGIHAYLISLSFPVGDTILGLILKNKVLNMPKYEIGYWNLANISAVLANIFFLSIFLALPITFFVTANTVLYKKLAEIPRQNVANLNINTGKFFIKGKVFIWCAVGYLFLVSLGLLFNKSVFDPCQANYHFACKEYSKAVEYYSKVLKRNPKYHKGYLRIGYSLARMGDTDKNRIMKLFDKALSMNTKYMETEFELFQTAEKFAHELYQDGLIFGKGSYHDAESIYAFIVRYRPKNANAKKNLVWIRKIETDIYPHPFSDCKIVFFDGPIVNGIPKGIDTDFLSAMGKVGVSLKYYNRLYKVMDKDCQLRISLYSLNSSRVNNQSIPVQLNRKQKKGVVNTTMDFPYYKETGKYRLEVYDGDEKIASNTFMLKNENNPANMVRLFYHYLNDKSYNSAYGILSYDVRSKMPSDKFQKAVSKIEYCYLNSFNNVKFKNRDECTGIAKLILKDYGEKEKKVKRQICLKRLWGTWQIQWSKLKK